MGDSKVGEFLEKLKTLDSDMYYYQREVILNSPTIEPARAFKALEPMLKRYDGMRPPFQGLDVGDAKNMSCDELENITDNFYEKNVVGKLQFGRLFRGFINDGDKVREVTVKTWDFIFPSAQQYGYYPRYLHDEIVALERLDLKSNRIFAKLIGFCFEKKLAVVYDLKFETLLYNSLTQVEFGWKQRMKVATDYALLMKTLIDKRLLLVFTTSDIMIDKDYNIKLVNFTVKQPRRADACVSDTTCLEKWYVFELGILLLELVMIQVRSWPCISSPSGYISQMKGRSVVDKSFGLDAETGSEITKLIGSCVHWDEAQRSSIDAVLGNLAKIGECEAGLFTPYP